MNGDQLVGRREEVIIRNRRTERLAKGNRGLTQIQAKLRLGEARNVVLNAEQTSALGVEHVGDRARLIVASLRDFTPTRKYDLVWIQWVLGHLTDADVVLLLQRCRAALAHGGCLVVKDNNAVPSECRASKGRGKYKLDEANGAVVRTHNHLRTLFRRAGLRCDRFELQRGFPAELYAVRSYLLVAAAA